jgi:hypothetical protein
VRGASLASGDPAGAARLLYSSANPYNKDIVKTVFIDYTGQYYQDVAGLRMPGKRGGKFVQLRHGNIEYLIFAPKEYIKYHANLVERFCRDNGIIGSYDRERKRFDIEDPSWVVSGGGKFEIDSESGQIRLYEDSMAYGKFDGLGLKDRLRTVCELSDYEVRIE